MLQMIAGELSGHGSLTFDDLYRREALHGSDFYLFNGNLVEHARQTLGSLQYIDNPDVERAFVHNQGDPDALTQEDFNYIGRKEAERQTLPQLYTGIARDLLVRMDTDPVVPKVCTREAQQQALAEAFCLGATAVAMSYAKIGQWDNAADLLKSFPQRFGWAKRADRRVLDGSQSVALTAIAEAYDIQDLKVGHHKLVERQATLEAAPNFPILQYVRAAKAEGKPVSLVDCGSEILGANWWSSDFSGVVHYGPAGVRRLADEYWHHFVAPRLIARNAMVICAYADYIFDQMHGAAA
jgi:hypothetical protein